MNNLLDKIKSAFAAVNEAEAPAKAAKDELVSRAKTLGLLLLDAHKHHPTRAKFQSFLKEVNGLGLSRAYDFMAVAGGRTTVQELRDQATNRKRKSRAKKKPPQSVTDPPVTESPEVSIEQHQAEMAALDMTEEEKSARALAEFTVACRHWLPKITDEAQRQTARALVIELTSAWAEAA
jgi:hypothetical protein